LNQLCLIRETSEMCSAVVLQDQDWEPPSYKIKNQILPCYILHAKNRVAFPNTYYSKNSRRKVPGWPTNSTEILKCEYFCDTFLSHEATGNDSRMVVKQYNRCCRSHDMADCNMSEFHSYYTHTYNKKKHTFLTKCSI